MAINIGNILAPLLNKKKPMTGIGEQPPIAPGSPHIQPTPLAPKPETFRPIPFPIPDNVAAAAPRAIDPAEAGSNQGIAPPIAADNDAAPKYKNRSRLEAGFALGLKTLGDALANGAPLGQALGAGLGAGAASAIAPGVYTGMRSRAREAEYNAKQAAQRKQHAENVKLEGEVLDNEGKKLGLTGKQLENRTKEIGINQEILSLLRSTNKPLYDSVVADDQVTDEEAKLLNSAGYPVKPYDARKFDVKDKLGITYASPDKGLPDYRPLQGLPQEKAKQEIEYTSPSGNKFTLNQNQAAQFEMAIIQGDANRAMQVIMQNNRIENENVENKNKAGQQKEGFLAERDGFISLWDMTQKRIYDANQALTLMKNSDAPDIEAIQAKEKEIAGMEKTRDEALAKAKEYEQKYNRYQMPQNLKPVDEKKIPKLAVSRQKNLGGKNNNIGTVGDFQNALKRLKKTR